MSTQDKYGFNSTKTIELIGLDEGNEVDDIGEVLEKCGGSVSEGVYEDLAQIYEEDEILSLEVYPGDDLDQTNVHDDIDDGDGCAEVWEKLSRERRQ